MTPRSSDDDPLEDEKIRPGREPEDPDAVASRIQAIIDAAQSAAAGILKDAEAQARTQIESSRERAEEVASERVEGIYSVTETLVEQARKVRERSGELVEALDDAIRHVDQSEPDSDGPKPKRRNSSKARTAEPKAKAKPEPEPQAGDSPGLRDRVTSSLRAERERLDEMMNRVSETTKRFTERASRPTAPEEPASKAPPEEEPVAEVPEPKPEPKPSKRVPRKARLLATRMAVAGSSRAQISDKLRDEHGLEDADALLDEILGPE
jgi:ElaB/YqjD/DUF883 family membrane-anchored ribosome-binding protein